MLLVLKQANSIYIVELTVPWEDRLDTSHQLKSAKYSDLIEGARIKGLHASQFSIEVGCRGFVATSTCYFLRELGLQPFKLKKANPAVSSVAESSFRWLWIKRNDEWSAMAK